MNKFTTMGFTGECPDPLTFAYPLGNGYRWYLPGLMRFNSSDSFSPFGAGGINSYVYCAADPVNSSDPSGHMVNPIQVLDEADEVALTTKATTLNSDSLAAINATKSAGQASTSAKTAGLKSILKRTKGSSGNMVSYSQDVVDQPERYTAKLGPRKLPPEEREPQPSRLERFAGLPQTAEDYLATAETDVTAAESALPVLAEHAPMAATKYAGDPNAFTRLKRWNKLVEKAKLAQRRAAEDLSGVRTLLEESAESSHSLWPLWQQYHTLRGRALTAGQDLLGFNEISWLEQRPIEISFSLPWDN